MCVKLFILLECEAEGEIALTAKTNFIMGEKMQKQY